MIYIFHDASIFLKVPLPSKFIAYSISRPIKNRHSNRARFVAAFFYPLLCY